MPTTPASDPSCVPLVCVRLCPPLATPKYNRTRTRTRTHRAGAVPPHAAALARVPHPGWPHQHGGAVARARALPRRSNQGLGAAPLARAPAALSWCCVARARVLALVCRGMCCRCRAAVRHTRSCAAAPACTWWLRGACSFKLFLVRRARGVRRCKAAARCTARVPGRGWLVLEVVKVCSCQLST